GGPGDVVSEDVRGDGGPPRGYLGQFVSVLVVLARDVIELEAIEFVLEAAYCVVVRLHLQVVTARLLHYLVDDELDSFEVFDAELDGDAEATEEGLILRHIVRSREV